MLCTTDCPTGYIDSGDECTLQREGVWHFDMFARQTRSHEVEGMQLDVASLSGNGFAVGMNDPIAVYGRGFWYQEAVSVFSGLNLGYYYSLLIWYKATTFNSLFSIYNGSESMMGISAYNDAGVMSYQIESKTVADNTQNPRANNVRTDFLVDPYRFSLLGNWNTMLVTVEIEQASRVNTSTGPYNVTWKMFTNGWTEFDTLTTEWYFEDRFAFDHFLGGGKAEGSYFNGFIGDVIYANYVISEG